MIKRIIKRLLMGHRSSSEAYVAYLKKRGANIGEGVYFFSPESTNIDAVRIDCITIGNYTKITSGCTILAHDYSSSVLLHAFHEILLPGGNEVKIGNNCFIGMNTTILMGCKIGDNVIIGSGSLVTNDIPSNSVVGGIPARKLMSLDEYYEKRKDCFINDAVRNVLHFKKIHNRMPDINEIGAFSVLTLVRNEENYDKYVKGYLSAGNDLSDIRKAFFESNPAFESYQAFLEYCISHQIDDSSQNH